MATRRATAPVPVERITQSILVIRGQRVIVDRDLATIFGVETRTLNQAVKRNAERFPEDFCFRLTAEEAIALRSQSVILKRGREAMASRSQSVILNGGRGHNVKFLPYAFTEHGAIQAANVLKSPQAVTMGIHVVRAFVQLRELLASNKELARKFAELERKVSSHDQAIVGLLKAIRELMNPPEPKRRPIGFIELEERK